MWDSIWPYLAAILPTIVVAVLFYFLMKSILEGDRRERIRRLELALGRAAQVRGHHHRRTGLQRHLDAGHGGADAGVLGDRAGVVLRDVEVGTDEDAPAGHAALGNQIGKSDDVHEDSRKTA